jgi:hypothetical protein
MMAGAMGIGRRVPRDPERPEGRLNVSRSAPSVVLVLIAAFATASCDKLKPPISPPIPQTNPEPPVPLPKPQDPGASGAGMSRLGR